MKTLTIFSLILSTACCINPELVEIIKTRMLETGMMCMSQLGATEADVAPLIANRPPETETGKCFLACMFKKEGFLNANGKIDKDSTMAAIEQTKNLDEDYYVKIKQVAEACVKVNDDGNDCETATMLYACILKEKAKVGLENIDLN
ncbi:hypothetical protein PPYR_04361 [Photinus pyralis]|uniref:Uncharacterized protein n=1 Tax=Photinus pyralis TaxID=7054 RepID=A0A5N4AXT3_PHOPY|nr:general odorant-binding protein 28a-like [Photinus pyralis]XP_031358102.1 general odorant-binding protein 28a-like [Photinus pyralis]KAB0802175.1 hypothetical protein PPYR_04361 [Photinus pyralis]